jgi:hypothetical protein
MRELMLLVSITAAGEHKTYQLADPLDSDDMHASG